MESTGVRKIGYRVKKWERVKKYARGGKNVGPYKHYKRILGLQVRLYRDCFEKLSDGSFHNWRGPI